MRWGAVDWAGFLRGFVKSFQTVLRDSTDNGVAASEGHGACQYGVCSNRQFETRVRTRPRRARSGGPGPRGSARRSGAAVSTRKAQRPGGRRDSACTHPLGRQVVGRVPRELARELVRQTNVVFLQRAFLRRLGVGEADRGERRAGRRVRLVIDAGDRGANRDRERRLDVGALEVVQHDRLQAGGRDEKRSFVRIAGQRTLRSP